MGKLDGEIALVTGGTSGIGKATAKLLADNGAAVIIAGRNKERGKETESELSGANGEVRYFHADVSNKEDILMLHQFVSENYGRLDMLFNNAGIWHTHMLEDITEEEYRKVFDTNTGSVIFMTQTFMPMLQASQGNIINVASIGGLQSHIAGRSQYLYAASKAAVIQFSQLCALNYAPDVRVNCLVPGPTDTPIYQNRDFSWVPDQIPMGRLGTPDNVAEAALYLATASYVTGAVLTVDGGASLK